MPAQDDKKGLATSDDKRLDGCGFIDFAFLELSVDGEVKVAVDSLRSLTIKNAQRAELLYRLLG